MKATTIAVDRCSGVPLARQFENALRDAIVHGRIAPGERLLSSRDLRAQLGLSRNTVVNALDQLHAEGYLVTKRGVGTFVAEGVQRRPQTERAARKVLISASRVARASLDAAPAATNLNIAVPFRPGVPAIDLIPAASLKRCFDARDWDGAALDYPDPRGIESLRAAIAVRLAQTRGIVVPADDIFITNGAQAAIDLIVAALLEPGDRAVVEDPGYFNVCALLRTNGIEPLGVRVDDQGLCVDHFGRKSARLAYLTPSHQYPTGAVLSLERRVALLEWAERTQAWIVEDDYDSEFNYRGRTQPALRALAADGRVIYLGTFSKTLTPALRIAYIVVPAGLKPIFAAMQILRGAAPNMLVQAALARFMSRGYFSRHVTRMRKIYDERRRFVLDAFSERFGNGIRIDDSRAGLHFVAHFPSGDDRETSAAAAKRGIVVPALSSYAVERSDLCGLLVGFAAAAPAKVRGAVALLAEGPLAKYARAHR